MSGPYRQGDAKKPAEAPGDAGIVGDLIAQFADRLAFYRELVQNAIDADSTRVDVNLLWEPVDGGTMRVSVRDRGEGMDQEILEEQLLVLFRSGKEELEGKIGKFGVGFISVLAVKPRLVTVQTCRAPGARLTLKLHPDHRYELFDAGPGTSAGTTVTLHVPVPEEAAQQFVLASQAALSRWCRHASLPIALRATLAGAEEPLLDVRIDEPLTLEGEVCVEQRSRDGETHVVVALTAEGPAYGGFFNSGLLLHESHEALAGLLSFKVLDSRLEHTLSRDNVRRDEAYEAALRVVAKAAKGPLVEAAYEELEVRAATGKHFWRLLQALRRSTLPFSWDEVSVPLTDAVDGRRWRTVGELRDAGEGHFAPKSGRLTQALASLGHPTVASRAGGAGALLVERFIELLRDKGRLRLVAAQAAFTLVQPVAPSMSDLALAQGVRDHLAALHRKPSAVVYGQLDGASDRSLFVGGPADAAQWVGDEPARVVPRKVTEANVFRLIARPPLVLAANHPTVHAARRRAVDEPELAAALLTRAVLTAAEAFGADEDEALTERALESILGVAP